VFVRFAKEKQQLWLSRRHFQMFEDWVTFVTPYASSFHPGYRHNMPLYHNIVVACYWCRLRCCSATTPSRCRHAAIRQARNRDGIVLAKIKRET